MKKKLFITTVFFFLLLAVLVSCASRGAAQAEEYFSIGMAYYEMGKFAEAEKWLNRAQAMDKTMTASDYNLGRIAYETERYGDAAKHFERILSKDPNNVLALKAAAYSRVKNGDLEKGEALYNRVLALVPESADDGFNYALVLYAMKKYENSEEVLNRYPFALEENAASILLMARVQKAQDKVEAIDTYAKWVIVNAGTANPQGLYEYAQMLESAGFYARSLEQYKEAIKALSADTKTLKKSKLRFEQARLLLTADPENKEGITELNTAVTEGFDDTEEIKVLLSDERITQAHKDEITKILDNIVNKAKLPAADPKSRIEDPTLADESKQTSAQETQKGSPTGGTPDESEAAKTSNSE